jgi:hypothetical protein
MMELKRTEVGKARVILRCWSNGGCCWAIRRPLSNIAQPQVTQCLECQPIDILIDTLGHRGVTEK